MINLYEIIIQLLDNSRFSTIQSFPQSMLSELNSMLCEVKLTTVQYWHLEIQKIPKLNKNQLKVDTQHKDILAASAICLNSMENPSEHLWYYHNK